MEACWAHNPEVRVSKPRSAKSISFLYHCPHTIFHLEIIILASIVILTCVFIFVKLRDYFQITGVFFFLKNLYDYIEILHYIEKVEI